MKLLSMFITVLPLCVAATASASEFESNGRTAEVRFQDLDLTQPQGQRALKMRIKKASWQVCRSSQDAASAMKCRDLAEEHVRDSVELAIVKAQNGQRFAEIGKEKGVSLGN
ncbi:UrcA family protein [Sphingobium chlorophenolicum]|nr:UrcA family protein [Sphingobium chlorophenolicum]